MTGVSGRGRSPGRGGVLAGAESRAGKARSSGNSGGGVPGGIPGDTTELGGTVLVGGHLGSAPLGRVGDYRTQGDGTGDLRSPGTLLGEESGTLGAAALPPACSILRSPEISRDRGTAAAARTAFALARPPPRCRRWSGGFAVLRQPEAKAPPQPEACTSPRARRAPARSCARAWGAAVNP